MIASCQILSTYERKIQLDFALIGVNILIIPACHQSGARHGSGEIAALAPRAVKAARGARGPSGTWGLGKRLKTQSCGNSDTHLCLTYNAHAFLYRCYRSSVFISCTCNPTFRRP